MAKSVRTAKSKKQAGEKKPASPPATALIGVRKAESGDWRGEVLGHIRRLITEADPQMTEEVKWRKPSNPEGVAVWSHNGGVCTGESYKQIVKLTFFKGASLKDPAGLLNSSLDGNVRRAIDIHQGERINEPALKDLIRAAVALNLSAKRK